MILHGLLDRSLGGFLCIRGFAPLGDLARSSAADHTFQRELIKTHRQQIVDFLGSDYMFFPEVILACRLRYDFEKGRSGISPLGDLQDKRKFVSNVDALDIRVRPLRLRGKLDVRSPTLLSVATVEIDEGEFSQQNGFRFARIDGNHRLSAAQEETKFQSLRTPFCILLFDQEDTSKRSQKIIFHNINARSIPLTPEENLRVILDDEGLFPDELLKEKVTFGWEYYLARKIGPKLSVDYLEHIAAPLTEKRTALVEVCKFLLDQKSIGRTAAAEPALIGALKTINSIYGMSPALKDNQSMDLLAAFLHWALTDAKQRRLAPFARWVETGRLGELKKVDAASMVAVFDKIMTARHRTIFVSMQFCRETEGTYLAIKKIVAGINKKHGLDIRLREIRIDQFVEGHSYKIDDAILSLIEGSGLLIADLTFGNKNVYHELGYLMGLNQGKGLVQDNFILIHDKQTRSKQVEQDVAFNIKAYQQLRFRHIPELEEKLTVMIERHYQLPSHP